MVRDIMLRRLDTADLTLLLSIREGLFDNHVDPVQAAAFLHDPRHEIVLALAGNEAVGFATGTILLHPDKAPAMFVNEIGVREEWRRQGIGRAVTGQLFVIARERGCQGIWLGTEPDNGAALALYRSLQGDEVTFTGFGWDDAL